MIKNIFIDLDGTLLPMDNDEFIKRYFSLLGQKAAANGYDPKKLGERVMTATYVVLQNDGKISNEELFFTTFEKLMGHDIIGSFADLKAMFADFYEHDFDKIKEIIADSDSSTNFLKDVMKKYNVVIATTPVFPAQAVNKRLSWIGYGIDDFVYVTTYENSSYAKPNPLYYQDLLNKLNYQAQETLMVGNDMVDDIVPADKIGLKTFFLDDYPLNDGKGFPGPRGSFKDLSNYLCTLSR